MRALLLLPALGLAIAFFRADIQLIDLFRSPYLFWTCALGLVILSALAFQSLRDAAGLRKSFRLIRWGAFVTAILGLLEYSVEWSNNTALANNQSAPLSGGKTITFDQITLKAKNGTFATYARINDISVLAQIDPNSSDVILDQASAAKLGIYQTGPFLINVQIANISIVEIPAKIARNPDQPTRLGNDFLQKLTKVETSADRIVLRKER